MLTVLNGTQITRIPVVVLDNISQPNSSFIRRYILIRLLDSEVAQGMSGSPVYIDGKLIGAVRSTWSNSHHDLALVTPIEDMQRIIPCGKSGAEIHSLSSFTLRGISSHTDAMQDLSCKLGGSFIDGSFTSSAHVHSHTPLKPGSSLTVYLIWGDAELSALGTVTSVDKHGNILAFGHELLRRGEVSYPFGGAYIHGIIHSAEIPLKLSSSGGILGTITQDRDAGIYGTIGKFCQSLACELNFTDMDDGRKTGYKFRTIADPVLSSELITSAFKGITEEAYRRKGEGTMSIKLSIDGVKTPENWTVENIYYSASDIITEGFKNVNEIISAYLTQPFEETMPCGFRVSVKLSRNPKILFIEDIKAPSSAKPGQSIDVTVKLHEYRKPPITRNFTLKIPSNASGTLELIVRGGGNQSLPQSAIAGGWKAITSLENMLTELQAMDTNNELILELNADNIAEILNGRKSPLTLPEEEEYLSETKLRRKREGTLKIYRSEYYIDGLMRRIIQVESKPPHG